MMDKEHIEEVIAIAQAWELDELEVEDNRGRVRIVRRCAGARAVPALSSKDVDPASASTPESVPNDIIPEGLHAVRSPMVGVYIASDSSGDKVPAGVGDVIRPGDPVGFVEAMKMQTEIAADIGGKLVEMLVADGQPVQFDQPIVLIRPDTDSE